MRAQSKLEVVIRSEAHIGSELCLNKRLAKRVCNVRRIKS